MNSSDEFGSYKSDSTPIISNVKQINGARRQKIGLDVELTAPAFALPGILDKRILNYKIPEAVESLEGHLSHLDINLDNDDPEIVREVYNIPQIYNEQTEENNKKAKALEDSMNNPQFYIPDMDLKKDENVDSYNKIRYLFFKNSMKNNLSRLRQKNLKFSDIVDVDYTYYDDYVKNKLATRLEESNYFRYTMCLIVILNCVLIGLQTDDALVQKNPALFDFLDLATLSVYIMEIVLKWYIDFWGFWRSGWNIFDFALVAVGILGRYASFLGSNSRILKILRVLRSLRSFKSITFMSGIQAIIATLINSVPEMINIIILLLIFMFIFAVLGVTLFSPFDNKHFGNLGSTMYTLFIILTQDGWADIYDFLYDAGQSLFASIYFSLFIIIGPFIFINMIVAVVVTNFESFYMEKKKQEKLKMRKLVTEKTAEGKGSYQRSVLPFPDTSSSVFRDQIPYEIPDLSKISLEKLHKYFLILMLIEENLKEFLEIKTELVEIFKVVQETQNALDEGSESSEDESIIFDDDENRDVLSRWIRSRHHNL